MFKPLPAQFDFPANERRVLEFWAEHDVFAESLRIRAGRPRFVFYEGPPTANGLPHPGHCLTRAMKDLFPRYRTMCGYLVERKAGWDTHGLPVEVEVCKELGIHSKEEIEAYGVEKFVHKCIHSVWRYTREWEEMTRRLGFWVNLEDAYATYHQSYVESVWWGLKNLFERGLLYQGHKVVWWWAQGGTALSSGEVGEGYRLVDDPSVYVKFPLVAEGSREPKGTGSREQGTEQNTSLLVWTTTPWTLVSNHFAAVGPEIDYALVHDAAGDEYYWVAEALVAGIAQKIKRELPIVGRCRGSELIGRRYLPPMPEVYHGRPAAATAGRVGGGGGASAAAAPMGAARAALRGGGEDAIGWRITAADFVTLDSGTGLVHEAPAFGEVDFNLLQDERRRFAESDAIPLLCAVNPDGKFNADAPERYRGRWVKECDKEIIRELRDERKTPWGTPLLLHQEQVRHEYPFCPRAENDPLIQYARKSWFVRTSQFKDEFLKNNAAMQWLPEHIKEGRFGDFLRNNVDWALSRERYWGTPLPIWQCERCGRMEAIGSFADLRAKPGATDATAEYPQGFWTAKVAEHAAAGEEMPEHLRVHKPYIDAWTYGCGCEGTGNREQGTGNGERGPGNREQGTAEEGTEGGRDGGTTGAARMRRVPEVIDCWWDAGSMPFAQWGFPHAEGSVSALAERFPADFISEAIDQTRGWFYGLLAISTLLFSKAAVEQALRFRRISAETRHEAVAALLGSTATGRRVLAEVTAGATGESEVVARIGAVLKRIQPDFPVPFRTCIVLGHMMGEDGNKMSKRLRNYKEPGYIFDALGADAMRWYFFSAQVPWTSTRFVEASIRDAQREFLVRLYNVLSFFTIYASIDGFDPRVVEAAKVCPPDGFDARPPAKAGGTPALSAQPAAGGATRAPAAPSAGRGPMPMGWRPSAERTELDRWIITELRSTVAAVRASLDRFENYPAAQRLNEFVDALSNWYVRRSRDRFWRARVGPAGGPAAPEDQDKWDAYHTLYGCLRVLSRLIAPFTPFFAETMHQTLRIPEDPVSVHLCDYLAPEDIRYQDDALSAEMDIVREIASLGRAGRATAAVKEARKVRQPLARVEIVLARHEHEEWLRRHADLIAEELNVKAVEFTTEADRYVTYKVVPNFKAIGEKYRALVPKIKSALAAISDPAAARRQLLADNRLPLSIDGEPVYLTGSEVEVRLEARPGWSAAQGRAGVVVVQTDLTRELLDEGIIREFTHHVQAERREQDLPYEQQIDLYVDGATEFRAILERFEAIVQSECLARRIQYQAAPASAMKAVKVEGHDVRFAVVVA